MKIIDQVETATGANATTDNVLQGRRFERAPFDGYLSIYATGSAAGLQTEINVGGRSVSQRMPINTNNRLPLVPDDFLVGEVEAYQGELIQITQANTTAGSLTGRYRVELEQAQRAY